MQGPGPIFQVWWSRAFNLLQPSNTFATVPKNMPVKRPTGPASLKPASIFCCRWLGRLGTRHYNVPLFAVHDFTLLFISHYPNVKLTTNCSITKWLWVEAASIRASYSSPRMLSLHGYLSEGPKFWISKILRLSSLWCVVMWDTFNSGSDSRLRDSMIYDDEK